MSAPPKFATLPDAIAAYLAGRSRRWAEVDGHQVDLHAAAHPCAVSRPQRRAGQPRRHARHHAGARTTPPRHLDCARRRHAMTYCAATGKIQYANRDDARRAARGFKGRGVPGSLGVYHCTCGSFHIGRVNPPLSSRRGRVRP